MTRYEDHGLKPGCSVIRLLWQRTANDDPKIHQALYRYDTAASHHRGHLERQGIKVEQSRVEWDGQEYVSTDNGD